MAEKKLTSQELIAFMEGVLEPEEADSLGAEGLRRDDTAIELDDEIFQQELKEINTLPPLTPVSPVVLRSLRQQRAKYLLTTFLNTVGDSRSLSQIQARLYEIFQKTFVYPFPRFVTFGEGKSELQSPFGKVRYPIVFQWEPEEDAEQYQVAVYETSWKITTKETKVVIYSPEECRLTEGKEYTWERKIIKAGKEIEEETRWGWFLFPSSSELQEVLKIEKKLNKIESEEDRLILFGGALESLGFYMEAIEQYKQAYDKYGSLEIPYRIAACYHELELEGPREEWNQKIPLEQAQDS